MMKGILNSVILLALIFPFAGQATEIYTLDPYHTYVQWRINHFGFSNPSGKWFANGTLELDEAHPQNSKLDVKIPLENFVTGIPKLDEHLKTDTFFDIAKYPMATFVSDKIELTGKKTAKVTGTLNLHGISKPITLDVKLNQEGISPLNNKKTVGFSASTKLKRSDFGMNAYLPGLGDEVDIEIEAEANLN